MDLGEYENSENKLSLNEWKEVAESVAAFATAKGGVVRIGIDPGTSQKKGVQIGQTTLEQLANNIKANTNPPQFPSIQVENLDALNAGDRAVIEIHVEESPVKPVWAFGRPCKRVGRTNQKLSPEETRRLMEMTTGRTWDALPRPGFRASDVDRSLMQSFLRRAGQDRKMAGRWPEDGRKMAGLLAAPPPRHPIAHRRVYESRVSPIGMPPSCPVLFAVAAPSSSSLLVRALC